MTHVWTRVGRVNDVPRRGARRVETPWGVVAVFRTSADRLFALDDRCPHRGGPLSQGIVHGDAVTCPLHNWVIELEPGAARAPDQGCVRRFEIRSDDGWIEVLLPASGARAAQRIAACG